MTPDAPARSELAEELLKRDLHATIRLNLAVVGVWLSDGQRAGLVDALVARLDGEWRVRRMRSTPPSEMTP